MKKSLSWWVSSLSFLAFYTPASVRHFFAQIMAILLFDIMGFRKKVMLENLQRAMPELAPHEQRRIARRCIYEQAEALFDFLILPRLDQAWLQKNVEFIGFENWQNANAKGKGVLLLSLHMSNGDFGINLMSMKGMPIHLISKKFAIKFLNDFWFAVRGGHGTKFIDPHGKTTAFDILKVCRNKETVIFVIDQYMGPPYGVPTKFFNIETGTAYGLALFAKKTGAPVVPMHIRKDDQNKKWIVQFDPEIPQLEVEDKDQYLIQQTQAYNDHLEKIIRTHPDQWLWLHRRWKKYHS